jgi:hypothetical protein
VHQTFAEFLTAQHFKQMIFGQPPDEEMGVDEVQFFLRKLFKKGVSQQTMRFVEGFCDKNKDDKFHTGVLGCIEEIKKRSLNVFATLACTTCSHYCWVKSFTACR